MPTQMVKGHTPFSEEISIGIHCSSSDLPDKGDHDGLPLYLGNTLDQPYSFCSSQQFPQRYTQTISVKSKGDM